MKRNVVFAVALASVFALMAEDLHVLPLDKPRLDRGSCFMKTVSDRSSNRDFSGNKIGIDDLSDLLWAANGINRPEKGGRTAPSGLNKQEVDIYVVMEEGAYFYDFKNHLLIQRSGKDLRAEVAGSQEAMKVAPVFILLVADMDRVGRNDEQSRMMCAVDVGVVCQNINLYCASVGLSTVPRASMNVEVLKKELSLGPNQLLMMNNPVGYKLQK